MAMKRMWAGSRASREEDSYRGPLSEGNMLAGPFPSILPVRPVDLGVSVTV